MAGELVSITEACVLAGVTRRTIYNWITKNKVQYQRTVGGRVRILADSLFAAGNRPAIVPPLPRKD